MLRRILGLFLAGKLLRLFSGSHGGHYHHGRGAFRRHAYSHGHRSRHHALTDLMGLMGWQRRRRSFI